MLTNSPRLLADDAADVKRQVELLLQQNVALHERLPSQVKEITVPENGEAKADFTLGIMNLPKY